MTYIFESLPLMLEIREPEALCHTFRSPSSPPVIIKFSVLSKMVLKIWLEVSMSGSDVCPNIVLRWEKEFIVR